MLTRRAGRPGRMRPTRPGITRTPPVPARPHEQRLRPGRIPDEGRRALLIQWQDDRHREILKYGDCTAVSKGDGPRRALHRNHPQSATRPRRDGFDGVGLTGLFSHRVPRDNVPWTMMFTDDKVSTWNGARPKTLELVTGEGRATLCLVLLLTPHGFRMVFPPFYHHPHHHHHIAFLSLGAPTCPHRPLLLEKH